MSTATVTQPTSDPFASIAQPVTQQAASSSDPFAAIAQPVNQQPSDYLSKTEDAMGNAANGVVKGFGDLWGMAKNIPAGIYHSLPPVALVDSVKQTLPIIDSYEKARASGAGIMDALNTANEKAKDQEAIVRGFKERAAEFQKNPTQETARGLTDIAGLVAAHYLTAGAGGAGAEGEAIEGAAVAPEADAVTTAAPKPGIVKQVMQGEKVAQAPAQATLRSGAQASAADAGVAAGDTTGGIRTLLDDPIENLSKLERESYDKINEASGTDLKSLYDHANDVQEALEDPTNIANRTSLQKDLQGTQSQIAEGEAKATENGVDPDTLNDAKAKTQQRYAMENVNQKLFNNESVVKGNVGHGAPETINVDSAIRQVENLDKPSRFAPRGTPSRLQQALGEDGAKNIKQGLYDAQKQGQTALSRQQFAGKILQWGERLGGVGAAGYGVYKLFD
jgi:hypothetical protein